MWVGMGVGVGVGVRVWCVCVSTVFRQANRRREGRRGNGLEGENGQGWFWVEVGWSRRARLGRQTTARRRHLKWTEAGKHGGHSEGARAVLQKRFPMLMKHPVLGAARTITLEQILAVAREFVTQKKIDEALADLRRA